MKLYSDKYLIFHHVSIKFIWNLWLCSSILWKICEFCFISCDGFLFMMVPVRPVSRSCRFYFPAGLTSAEPSSGSSSSSGSGSVLGDYANSARTRGIPVWQPCESKLACRHLVSLLLLSNRSLFGCESTARRVAGENKKTRIWTSSSL